MGAADVKSLQYSGSGTMFALGQNPSPGTPWVRYNAKSYTRTINYDTVSMRDDLIRTQGEQPPRGAAFVIGEQRQILVVSGTHAWGQVGETINPALAAVDDRLHQLWITPHGVIKAAMAHNATVQARTEGGKKLTAIAFVVPGKLKVNALVNEGNLVEKVESWSTNPVLGDMLTETTYTDYKAFDGVQFPTKITQKQGGFPTLELTVSEVKPNAPADIQVPDNVRQADRAGEDREGGGGRLVPDGWDASQRVGGNEGPSGGDRRAAERRTRHGGDCRGKEDRAQQADQIRGQLPSSL